MKRGYWSLLCAAGLLCTGLRAQESADKLTITLSDPNRPALVKVGIMSGGIRVVAYEGKDILLEANPRAASRGRQERSAEGSSGMRRIQNLNTGLSVEEDNNVVEISTSAHERPVDISLQVPRRTSLSLSSINDGDIKVEGVHGEIEANNINGGVTLTGVSGSVVGHALNEDLIVTLNEITAGKPMSFSSLNGKIDVTFPPAVKANVVMKSDNGEIYSDFDIAMDAANRKPVVEDARGKGGKYRVRLERAMHGTINGGGPEFQFKSFNGDIFIRKAAK